MLWHLWLGRARKPGLGPQHVAVEVFNVGSWLTHGDLALVWREEIRLDSELTWQLPGRQLGRVQPAVTCERTWDSTGGHRRDLWLFALLLLRYLLVRLILAGGSHPIWRLGRTSTVVGGLARSLSLSSALLFGLLLGWLL